MYIYLSNSTLYSHKISSSRASKSVCFKRLSNQLIIWVVAWTIFLRIYFHPEIWGNDPILELPPTSHHQDYSIFRIGNPELNLPLWLASWGPGGRPKSNLTHIFRVETNHQLVIIPTSPQLTRCVLSGLHDLTSGYEISLEAAASLETTSDTWCFCFLDLLRRDLVEFLKYPVQVYMINEWYIYNAGCDLLYWTFIYFVILLWGLRLKMYIPHLLGWSEGSFFNGFRKRDKIGSKSVSESHL